MALRLLVHGRVQAVGFRAWAVAAAHELGVHGFVRNLRSGSVEILVRGEGEAVQSFVEACRQGPPSAQVTHVEIAEADEDIAGPGFRQLPTL